MENQHQSLSEQQVKTQQKTSEQQAIQLQSCTNCGTSCRSGDKFCEECGMPLKVASCSNCGASTQPNWEICPQCGHGLHAELCSFCGVTMGADDTFCPDCGNPRTGIACPDCGALNFRSFCRKCNRPLNEAAMLAVQKAQKDPVFLQMLTVAQELADLEDQLLGDASAEKVEPEFPSVELSNEDKRLIQQYKELLANVYSSQKAPLSPTVELQPKTEEPVKARSKIQLSVKTVNLDEAKQSYKEKLEEMQRLMAKLLPDGDMTPQMQRDYYSARKLPVLRQSVTRAPAYWVCNLCGCRHNQPSECAEPQLGGTWVYKDVITTSKTFEYQDN